VLTLLLKVFAKSALISLENLGVLILFVLLGCYGFKNQM